MLVFFMQKTAYEMRISDWSSDVCSSDLSAPAAPSRRRPEMTTLQPAPPRHFLDLEGFDSAELRVMLDTAVRMKRGEARDGEAKPLAGKTLAMIFEKPSTRTRVSFEERKSTRVNSSH